MYQWECLNNRRDEKLFFKRIEELENTIDHQLWQSSHWAKFLNEVDVDMTLFILLEMDNICGWAVITSSSPIRGFKYSYLQRGPVGRTDQHINEILNYVYKRSGDYLLVDPSFVKSSDIIIPSKSKEVPFGVIPADSLVLDLLKTEDQLLKEMKKKGRYNLKLAQGKGLNVEQSKVADSKTFLDFYKLLKDTSKRQHISLLPQKDFEIKLRILNSTIFVISINLEPIAAGFFYNV